MDINDVIKYINSEFKSYDLNFRVSPKTRDGGNITGFSVKGSAIDAIEAFGFPHEFMNAVDAHTIINIKIDIDTDTPKGFGLEHMFKTHPFNYSVTILDKPSLFAAKTSAVVSRHWKNRVKERDLFDFEWYLENNTPINRNYLINNLCREGIISSPEISDDELLAIITNRFDAIDYKSAVSDLYPFVDNEMIPVDWSSIHFRELTKRLVFH